MYSRQHTLLWDSFLICLFLLGNLFMSASLSNINKGFLIISLWCCQQRQLMHGLPITRREVPTCYGESLGFFFVFFSSLYCWYWSERRWVTASANLKRFYKQLTGSDAEVWGHAGKNFHWSLRKEKKKPRCEMKCCGRRRRQQSPHEWEQRQPPWEECGISVQSGLQNTAL